MIFDPLSRYHIFNYQILGMDEFKNERIALSMVKPMDSKCHANKIQMNTVWSVNDEAVVRIHLQQRFL